jgi:hypothetical protein
MGFRVLLIAVSGKSPSDIHSDYAVVPTAKFDEIPESSVSGALLPSERYLLFINDRILPENCVLAKLSRHASLIACYGNETVMNSFASSWIDGVEHWTVFHDAQQGIRHLETSGTLPVEFSAIRDRFVAEQDEAGDGCGIDYIYDIAVKLFAALGGLRYNEDIPGATARPWQVLRRIA